MNNKAIKLKIIAAGEKAVKEQIKVAQEDIIKPDPDDELAADRLKNAAATKKLAIFDAFEILSRIEQERESILMSERGASRTDTNVGFAERRSRK